MHLSVFRQSRLSAPPPWCAWSIAVAIAVLGAVLFSLGLQLPRAPLDWVVPAAVLAAMGTAVVVCARPSGRRATELMAFTFAAMMLIWPFLVTGVLLLLNGSPD
jgi:hypothetical protein